MLKDKIFFLMPWIISSLDFAIPVNIIFFGSTPAAKTLSNSPPETISKPLPLSFNNLSTEILLRDFTEKQTNPSFFSKALEYESKLSNKVFFEYTYAGVPTSFTMSVTATFSQKRILSLYIKLLMY